MNSMRRRLMAMLALIFLFFQLVSVLWLWHESQEQIGFLVNETLSARTRNHHVEKEIHEAIASLLVPSLVMVGFTLFFSFLAVSWIIQPLNKLSRSLVNRSADNLSPLPMFSEMEEMVAVTTALNQLLSRLESTIQQERLFTADAAHELRTPLAGIRLHLELMAQSGNKQADSLIQRLDQLMHVIEQLLMLSRAGQALASGHYDTHQWWKDIIEPLQEEMTEMAERHNQRIIWPEDTGLSVQGDSVLLRLLLRNLLENAWRYSPQGSCIEIRLQEENNGAHLQVLDEGPGIDEAHRKTITEPFRRLDQRYGGSGLGLNIVRRIVQLHRGKLLIDNRTDSQGLNAGCWFPDHID